MKIISVKGYQNIYTSNVYLILGEWKRIEDVNTLIDVGNDFTMLSMLETINVGVGKNKVERVVLTHSHSDHTGILPLIKKQYRPKIYAFSPFMDGVDQVLKNGDKIRMGEADFEVIHTPGHTDDSICLVHEESGVAFSGDTPIPIREPGGSYNEGFYQALKKLCNKKIRIIYPGHGDPLVEEVSTGLFESLRNVRNSRVANA